MLHRVFPGFRLSLREPIFLSVFYLCISLWIVIDNLVRKIPLATGYVNSSHLFISGELWSIIVKTLFVHTFFFLVHLLVVNSLKTTRWVYSFVFIFQTTSIMYIYYPNVLLDLGIFVFLSERLGVVKETFLFPISLFNAVLLVYFSDRAKLKFAFISAGLLIFIVNFVAHRRNFNFENLIPASQVHSSVKKSRSDIILIGVDGLRPEALNAYVDNPNFPFLSRFLKESQKMKQVIVPLARTFPSIYSILSAKSPIEGGLRGNMRENLLDTDLLFWNTYLHKLKNSGYQITLGVDSSDFVFFKTGEIVSKVISPPPGMINYLLVPFYRDHLTFAWFNNIIGLKLFPEIIANGVLYETWWPQIFQQQIKKYWRESLNNEIPQFNLFHISRPHWPLANRAPYILNREPSFYSYSPFSSGTFRSWILDRVSTFSATDVYWNKKNYDLAVREVADFYLEGIFKELYQTKKNENSIVVLFSDHGESLHDDQLLTPYKAPTHGGNLLFGDDAEKALLHISIPGKKIASETLNKPFNMSDLLLLLDFHVSKESKPSGEIFSGRPIHSETDKWIESSFPGQIVDQNEYFNNIGSDKFGMPIWLSKQDNSLAKQRSVYNDNMRLTLYLSRFGYYIYLEKLGENNGNLVRVHRDLATRLFAQLVQIFKNDFNSGTLPEMYVDWTKPDPENLEWKLSSEKILENFSANPEYWQLQLFTRIAIEANYFHSPNKVKKMLLALLNSESVRGILRVKSETELAKWTFFNDVSSEVESVLSKSKLENPPFSYSQIGREIYLIFSLLKLGRQKEAIERREWGLRNIGNAFLVPTYFNWGLKQVFPTFNNSIFRVEPRARYLSLAKTKDRILSVADAFLLKIADLFISTKSCQLKSEPPGLDDFLSYFEDFLLKQKKYEMLGLHYEWLSFLAGSCLTIETRKKIGIVGLSDPLISIEAMLALEIFVLNHEKLERGAVSHEFYSFLGSEDSAPIVKRDFYRNFLKYKLSSDNDSFARLLAPDLKNVKSKAFLNWLKANGLSVSPD